jgi:ABC-type multidrug transport system fused ATPase/permease subunit
MGFHTTIGRMARDLPPSLAFRIGVARAIVSDPSLLLIEEPRSFPDESSADSYEQLLSSLRQNRTLIVLATRLATLRAADEIFVFHDGRLHAHGEHPKLLQEDALYRHLNYLLFNPFRSTVSLPSGNAANGRT